MPSRQPVLIVDDDAQRGARLGQALAQASLASEQVGSGQEALAWLERATPSLILVKAALEGPSGYDLLRALRSRPATAELPAVMLVASGDDEGVACAFEAGADDVLRTPFGPAELVARVRGQMRLRGYVETIAQRSSEAELLLELTQALASSLDLREMLGMVVRRVAEATGVDRCSIVLARERGDVGYVVASNDDDQVYNLPLDLEKYPEIRQVLQSGAPLSIDDASTHPLYEVVRREAPPLGYASLALVPIVFEGRALGVLFLRWRARHAAGRPVLALAQTIANATAVALRNARVLQSLRDQSEESDVARREAERRLRLTERYADVFESAADGIVVVGRDGSVAFSNPRAREILGFGKDAPASGLREVLDAPELATARRTREALERGEAPISLDVRAKRADGEAVTLGANVSLLHEDDAILVSFRDVTAERRTADELRKTKGFLERVIDSSVNAIVSADLRGQVLLFNRAAERCFGYAADEVTGKLGAGALYPPGVARRIMRLMCERGGRLENFRTEVAAKGGERVPVSMSAALIYEGGRAVGSVGIFTDLRDRIRMETRLVAAQEELKARERQALIAELAGATAHELNQPLTSMMAYAEMLKRRLEREAPAYAAAEVIFNEAQRMAEIVRKIGKITRYETKSYVGQTTILDLDKASEGPESGAPAPPGAAETP
ncbi:MAG TPA: PAS domain S-box protein [Polyangiaceae bacterium]|nr:PAS domain S-box protein [Polyangiaceae bacterium]